MKTWIMGLLWFAVASCLRADGPTVSHYYSVKYDAKEPAASNELILKVENPTDQTLYVYGSNLSDVPCQVEILKDGKWSPLPPRQDLGYSRMRPFQPHSYLLFTVDQAPLSTPHVTFRIHVYLYTTPEAMDMYVVTEAKHWVDAISPEFHSDDFPMPERTNSDIDLRSRLPKLPRDNQK